ncbi:MAG: PD-(D/E)XK nuclease family transposase [Spirochaetales bacterium]
MRIKGYSDLFIRWLFGATENNDSLLSFLNALQECEGLPRLSSVEVRNPFLLQRAYDDKLAVLDVLAVSETGQQFNVEVQDSNQPGFEERKLERWMAFLKHEGEAKVWRKAASAAGLPPQR